MGVNAIVDALVSCADMVRDYLERNGYNDRHHRSAVALPRECAG